MVLGDARNLYTDRCGPSVDPSALARMRRLDRGLAVTYSSVSINPLTSRPLETRLGLVRDPAFHLWSRDPDGRWWLVRSFPAAEGFGHREVARLEADVARRMSPSEILERHLSGVADRREAGLAIHRGYHSDLLKANRRRIENLLNLDDRTQDRGDRQARMFSYPGQSSRATPGLLKKDAREDGWESLPPPSVEETRP